MKKIPCTCALIIWITLFCTGFATDSVAASNSWTVSVDPLKPKRQNEYDVIVIGSGIGGLSCASILSTNGYKVLVLEQHSQIGGYCTSFEKNGFVFPVGAGDISGCDSGAIATLLQKLHLKKEDLFALHTRTYILDNKTLVFTGTDNDFVQKISQQFPKEQQQIEKFFQEAKRATEEMVATFKNPNLPCPTYEAWKKVSYQQKLDEFFYDKELKGILCSLLGYLGTKAEQTEAHKALLWCLRYFIYGGYYPKQGGKRFADALRQVIESHNGTVLTHARVDEILVTDGNVQGVRVCDKTFFSPIVVANANAKSTFLHLIPKGTLPESFTNAINSLKMSKSEAVVHLGVDMDLSNLSSLIRVSLPQTKCCFFINSNADPSTAPLRQSSISIGMTSLYNETPPNETTEYAAYKEALLEKAIINVEKIIPGIRNHIVVKEVVTPRTFERFTSMPEGALYAFDQSEGSVRPHFKTPIPGLYLASASTLLGGGVETVTISGMRCAQDIMHSNPSCVLLPSPSLTNTMSIEKAISERKSIRTFTNHPMSLST